ncbi:MAG: choice-of-anchor D domain-containing protein [Candidatus Kapabacteria bacterium]|nr:choice-of-anchor D domain-containing protein [Candidatus Kapabacteria bacterium]
MIMRRSVAFAVLTFLALSGQHFLAAQTLSVFQPNPSQFPRMSAGVYVLDANGKRVSLQPGDITISEGGVPRTVLSVDCPLEQPLRAISSLLCVDASSSMRAESSKNLMIATAAAAAWIRSFDFSSGDCALTSFNEAASVLTDFTTNPAALQQGLGDLSTADGTDYNAAFLQSGSGALAMMKNAKKNKVIIFLTDGLPSTQTRSSEIISLANQLGCRIYCISVGFTLPDVLRTIASSTNGMAYSGVQSAGEAENIYRSILAREQNITPCTITWQSCFENAGAERAATFRYRNSVSENLAYSLPRQADTRISISPQGVHFDAPIIGVKRDTTITLNVVNTTFTVSSIQSNNSAFSITPSTFSLKSGDSIRLTVSYMPQDERYTSATFTLATSLCSSLPIVASAGKSGEQPAAPTIRLITPNGGEKFAGGDSTLIRWNGIVPSDNVQLDFSSDNGSTWNIISSETSGGAYQWHVPNIATTQARVRVSHISAGSSIPLDTRILPHAPSPVVHTEFSPDGSEFLTCADSSVYLWSTSTGLLIRRVSLQTRKSVVQARYSKSGNLIFICTSDKNIRTWNRTTQQLRLVEFEYMQESISSDFSVDDTFIALASVQNLSSSIAVLRASTLEQIFEVNSARHNQSSFFATWLNSDNTRLITHSAERRLQAWKLSDSTFAWSLNGVRAADIDLLHNTIAYSVATEISIRDDKRDSVVQRIPHPYPVDKLAMSRDATRIAAMSNDSIAGNRSIIIYDTRNGATLATLVNRQEVTHIRFSQDNRFLVAATGTNTILLFDASSGRLLRIFSGHRNKITGVDILSNGEALVSSSYDYTARLMQRQPVILQSDTSDATFTIIQSAASITPVQMDDTDTTARTTKSVAHITNTGSDSLTLSGVSFEGNDARVFSLVSGLPVRVAAGASATVEYAFSPDAVKTFSAGLRIHAQHSDLLTTISGNGRVPVVSSGLRSIDFGTVNIGTSRDSTRAVILKNVSLSDLTVDSLRITGRAAAEYSIVGSTQSLTINAGDSLTLHLRYTPALRSRTSVHLRAYYRGGSSAINDVVLTGRGIQPGAGIATTNPQFSRSGCSPVIFDTLSITNTGTSVLRINDASFTGQHATDFALSSPFTTILIDSGKSAPLAIRCTPSASGLRRATLVLQNNSVDNPTFNLDLRATAQITGFSIDTAVDVGTICPNTPLPFDVTLRNTGDAANTYNTAGSSFAPAPSISVEANQSLTIRPTLLERTFDGPFVTYMVIRDERCNTTKQVQVRGVVQGERYTVADRVINGQRGTVVTDSITITNTSQRTLSFSSLPDISPMTFIAPQLPIVVPPSSSRSFRVQYNASGVVPDVVRAIFKTDGCLVSDTCVLQGIPGDALVEYSIESFDATAGKVISIPITTRRTVNIAQPDTKTVNVLLSFNASMLMPVDGTAAGTVLDGIRTIPLTLPVKSPNTMVTTVRFRTMLGNDTATTLTIRQDDGEDVAVTGTGGVYRTSQLCKQGGIRLFNPSGERTMMLLAPQPVGSAAEVYIHSVESGAIRVTLNDGIGRTISTVIERELDAGEYVVPIDMSMIPNGMYWLHLTTPTILQTLSVQVLR